MADPNTSAPGAPDTTIDHGPGDPPLRERVWSLPEGAHVRLAPGTYAGPIALPSGVTLSASGGMGSVTLEGTRGPTLSVEGAPTVTLRDLVIKGPTKGLGAAIQAYEQTELTLEGCLITGGRGRGEGGGGIDLQAGRLRASRCRFTRNVALQGGAIRAAGPVLAEVDNSVFVDNRVEGVGGGAVFADGGAELSLAGCTFTGGAGRLGSVALAGGRIQGGGVISLVGCLIADDVPGLVLACVDQGRVHARHSVLPRAASDGGATLDASVVVRAVGVSRRSADGAPAWAARFAVVLRGVGDPEALGPSDLYGRSRGEVWVGAVA